MGNLWCWWVDDTQFNSWLNVLKSWLSVIGNGRLSMNWCRVSDSGLVISDWLCNSDGWLMVGNWLRNSDGWLVVGNWLSNSISWVWYTDIRFRDWTVWGINGLWESWHLSQISIRSQCILMLASDCWGQDSLSTIAGNTGISCCYKS